MHPNTQTITPEILAELRAMLREELRAQEQERKAQISMFRRVCDQFADTLARYDYVKHLETVRTDGTTVARDSEIRWSNDIRNAIGTLLRATYRVDAVKKLPREHEQDIREFIGAVLELMEKKEIRPQAEEPGCTVDELYSRNGM